MGGREIEEIWKQREEQSVFSVQWGGRNRIEDR